MIDWMRFTFVTARRYSDLQDKHLALQDKQLVLLDQYAALQEEHLALLQQHIDLYRALVSVATVDPEADAGRRQNVTGAPLQEGINGREAVRGSGG